MKSLCDKREQYYCERLRAMRDVVPNAPTSSTAVMLYLLYAYDVVHTRFSQRLSQFGLTSAAFNVLMIVKQYGSEGCPLHEIGELLLVSRANVTGVVDSLEANGYVQRVPDRHDRRVRLACITQAGRDILESYLPLHYEQIRQDMSGLTEEDKHELTRLLKKLSASIQQTES